MDSFKIRDKKVVSKASATLKHRRIQKITSAFRFLELLVFFIILSKFSTARLPFPSLNLPTMTEYLRGLSATLMSPRFVFLVGNAIVILLLSISGQFSSGEGEMKAEGMDFYDEYVEKCRNNRVHELGGEEKGVALVYNVDQPKKKKIMSRCQSEKLERARGKDLRRSMSDKCRKSGRKMEVEDEMSSEEFRRTVEAFIARQQRILKEEEEI